MKWEERGQWEGRKGRTGEREDGLATIKSWEREKKKCITHPKQRNGCTIRLQNGSQNRSHLFLFLGPQKTILQTTVPEKISSLDVENDPENHVITTASLYAAGINHHDWSWSDRGEAAGAQQSFTAAEHCGIGTSGMGPHRRQKGGEQLECPSRMGLGWGCDMGGEVKYAVWGYWAYVTKPEDTS